MPSGPAASRLFRLLGFGRAAARRTAGRGTAAAELRGAATRRAHTPVRAGHSKRVTPPGPLVIIGGHEHKRRDREILERFARLCGGRGAAVAVLGVASERPRAVEEAYRPALEDLGLRVAFLELADRPAAQDEAAARRVEEADGLFFTGGDQLRITSLLGGTRVDAAVRARWQAGAPLAGTSAGASALSSTMIVGGDGDATPARNTIEMAPGLGLLPNSVIDQHFAQRGRIGRLLSALAQNPAVLGIGVDEDTAFIVGADGVCEVAGSRTVTVLDGTQVSATNASELGGDEALAVTDMRLHVLPAGWRFDLHRRRPLPPERAGRS
ncbi:MAG: cyanophycinase [Firmicutes bacterium]|nr:cyanophycinase [Bacillota bacterium]